jgi:hypothetical protein
LNGKEHFVGKELRGKRGIWKGIGKERKADGVIGKHEKYAF